MIKDSRGRTPAYVVAEGSLRHQPTGLHVNVKRPYTDGTIRAAMRQLKQKIREWKDKR
jgi:hypothetical protein